MIDIVQRLRLEKAELQRLERERIVQTDAPEAVLDRIDARIASLDASRRVLLCQIAKMAPGYGIALHWAVRNMAFDESIGTIRFNRRRGGCFTFGMPDRAVIAVWVEGGRVVRSKTIDW